MKFLTVFIFAVLTLVAFAQEGEPEGEGGENTEGQEESSSCTGKKFENAVIDETIRRLSKVQAGNLADFAKELLSKERQLKEDKELLKVKMEQLKVSEKQLVKRMLKFGDDQKEILVCIDKNEREKAQRINHIVSVISTMRPKEASNILSVQKADISVRILGLLTPAKAAKIFNVMDKEISARIQKQYLNMKK